MTKNNASGIGLTAGLFILILYALCLVWNAFISDPTLKTLHQQLLALTYPGFTWISVSSIIWGGILSFIYGWLGGAVFYQLKKLCCKQEA